MHADTGLDCHTPAGDTACTEELSSAQLRVLIDHCPDAQAARVVVPRLLEKAGLWNGMPLQGRHVLVKPNLLRAQALACTSPEVVAACCSWLLDMGAGVTVADSPGFGSAAGVASAIGLEPLLKKLGLQTEPMRGRVPVRLPSGDEIFIARTAMEADCILSCARLKAHSQMRLTMSCKNLYGCVPGLYKALYHTRQGCDPGQFATMQSSLPGFLPPVSGLIDAICAMHVTGPSGGKPYNMGLLGASASPVALDEAFCRIAGRSPEDVPLQKAFIMAGHPHCSASGAVVQYPLLAPEDVSVSDFVLPDELMHTSFRPGRLLRSCFKRIWDGMFH